MPVFYPPTNRLPAGSAGAPSVAFADDSNLGFYRASDDYLGFAAAGVASLRFTAGGSILGASLNNRVTLPASGDVEIRPNGSSSVILGAEGDNTIGTLSNQIFALNPAKSAYVPLVIQPSTSYPTLFGKGGNDSNGLLQIASHSSISGGIAFGSHATEETIYRIASGTLGVASRWRAGALYVLANGFELGIFGNSDGTKLQFNTSGAGTYPGLFSPRATGWGLPTGTLTRTTFDPSTVTLEQLAQRVAALITDVHVSGSNHALLNT